MAAHNDIDDNQCIENSSSDTDSTDSETVLINNRQLWKVIKELITAFETCKETMENLIAKPLEFLSEQTEVDLRADKPLLKGSEKKLREHVLLLEEGLKNIKKAMTEQSHKIEEFNRECSNDYSFNDPEDDQILQKDDSDTIGEKNDEDNHMMSNTRDSPEKKEIESLLLEREQLRNYCRMLQDCIPQHERCYAERYIEKFVHGINRNMCAASGFLIWRSDKISQEESLYNKRGLEKHLHALRQKLCVVYGDNCGDAIMMDLGILAVFLQFHDRWDFAYGINTGFNSTPEE